MHIRQQPENVLTVTPFRGDPSDNQLRIVGSFLKEIAKIDDVRHVMNRFEEYKIQLECERNFDDRVETVKKRIGAKFIDTLNISPKSSSERRTIARSKDNLNFGDTDENSDGEELSSKVRMIRQQDRLNLGELNSQQKLEYSFLHKTSGRAITVEEISLRYKIPTNLPDIPRPFKVSSSQNLQISKNFNKSFGSLKFL